jgi:hypothetical protein
VLAPDEAHAGDGYVRRDRVGGGLLAGGRLDQDLLVGSVHERVDELVEGLGGLARRKGAFGRQSADGEASFV